MSTKLIIQLDEEQMLTLMNAMTGSNKFNRLKARVAKLEKEAFK